MIGLDTQRPHFYRQSPIMNTVNLGSVSLLQSESQSFRDVNQVILIDFLLRMLNPSPNIPRRGELIFNSLLFTYQLALVNMVSTLLII